VVTAYQFVNEPGFNEVARRVLSARYLEDERNGKRKETPSGMFWRVARNVAAVDSRYGADVELAAEEFYGIMHRLEFLPNSPALINAGRELQQLSACFVLPVEDSLDSIFDTVKNAALIHKSGGGTGFSFSNVRPKGDPVKTTRGAASGPVSFMHVFDAATEAVRQGGVRRGANMGVLRADHPDILEFIDAKSDCGGLRNFNISVAASDEFMEAAASGRQYPLIHPRNGRPVGHLNASEVLRRISRAAWRTGDPGLIFIDAMNRDNPTPALGAYETTNPCGEQPLLPYESCNLGSINLSRMTRVARGKPAIDFTRLARVTRSAVHFLDNVIDAGRYPLPAIAELTRRNRKIGLGVMGWADLLIALRVSYASDEALHLAGKAMGFIRRVGHRMSCELAATRGPYANGFCSGRPQAPSRRNATVTTIAPTGTISIIAGCSSGIEPVYALGFARRNVLDGGTPFEMHPAVVEEISRFNSADDVLEVVRKTGSLRNTGIPDAIARLYATAHEIQPEWHVRMQAAFQKHCDNAVSKTVNLPREATCTELERIFLLAYRLGCKGITVFRDGCRESQVLTAGCPVCG
jgi:ribonucleoside-diphosphate reductase alpha chain